jgi:hypothetical protein
MDGKLRAVEGCTVVGRGNLRAWTWTGPRASAWKLTGVDPTVDARTLTFWNLTGLNVDMNGRKFPKRQLVRGNTRVNALKLTSGALARPQGSKGRSAALPDRTRRGDLLSPRGPSFLSMKNLSPGRRPDSRQPGVSAGACRPGRVGRSRPKRRTPRTPTRARRPGPKAWGGRSARRPRHPPGSCPARSRRACRRPRDQRCRTRSGLGRSWGRRPRRRPGPKRL